jgi:hypothetical protein
METLTYIAQHNKDAGKQFEITKMSADDAEWFAIRAFLALGSSGVEVPEDIQSAGAYGMLKLGISGFFKIKPDVLKPLLDEMMETVKYIPDPATPMVKRQYAPGIIEDVRTKFEIRKTILSFNTDFFDTAAIQTSGSK